MVDIAEGEDIVYDQSQIEQIIQTSIEETLSNQTYEESKVPEWINTICEKVVKELVGTNKPYKYITTCCIM